MVGLEGILQPLIMATYKCGYIIFFTPPEDCSDNILSHPIIKNIIAERFSVRLLILQCSQVEFVYMKGCVRSKVV